MTWNEIELVWIEYLKTKNQSTYDRFRKLSEEYAERVWGKDYRTKPFDKPAKPD
jgi:hypothetical protein